MSDINILIISGTIREGNMTQHVSNLIKEEGKKIEDVKVKVVKPSDFKLLDMGNDAPKTFEDYREVVDWADAFFIVTPEYNHSYPGSLKALLDGAYPQYSLKPVAIASLSSGNWGGVRAIEALLPAIRKLNLFVRFNDVNFPKVSELFDDKGKLKNEDYRDRVKAAYKKLLWDAKTLKWGRENLSENED